MRICTTLPCALSLAMSASVALAADPPPPAAPPPQAAPAELPPAPPAPPPTPEQSRASYQRYLREMKLREPTVKVRKWYGWQNLIMVGASDALILGSLSVAPLSRSSLAVGLGFVAAGCRVGCGAIVHWAHGHVGRGFSSLLLNAGLPLATVGLSFTLDDEDFALGLILAGLIAAPGIDAGVLAFEDEVDVPRSELEARRSPLGIQSMAVLPILQKNQLGLSFVGQF